MPQRFLTVLLKITISFAAKGIIVVVRLTTRMYDIIYSFVLHGIDINFVRKFGENSMMLFYLVVQLLQFIYPKIFLAGVLIPAYVIHNIILLPASTYD